MSLLQRKTSAPADLAFIVVRPYPDYPALFGGRIVLVTGVDAEHPLPDEVVNTCEPYEGPINATPWLIDVAARAAELAAMEAALAPPPPDPRSFSTEELCAHMGWSEADLVDAKHHHGLPDYDQQRQDERQGWGSTITRCRSGRLLDAWVAKQREAIAAKTRLIAKMKG